MITPAQEMRTRAATHLAGIGASSPALTFQSRSDTEKYSTAIPPMVIKVTFGTKVIDLPAAMPGLSHHGKRDGGEGQDQIQRSLGELPEITKPKQLDPGGDAGERKAKKSQQCHVTVLIDDGLGNSGHFGIGQRPHR